MVPILFLFEGVIAPKFPCNDASYTILIFEKY